MECLHQTPTTRPRSAQNETRWENQREQFISARNEHGQLVPMGGSDYGNKDYAGSSSKDYDGNGNNGNNNGGNGNSNNGNNGNNGNNNGNSNGSKDKNDDKSDMGNMLRHIESLEAKLVGKDRQLLDAQQYVEKFSSCTREGMQSALDSLMKKWMDACENKDDKCKEQFKTGMEKLVQSSAEENGVWQMMAAASALHQQQEHGG